MAPRSKLFTTWNVMVFAAVILLGIGWYFEIQTQRQNAQLEREIDYLSGVMRYTTDRGQYPDDSVDHHAFRNGDTLHGRVRSFDAHNLVLQYDPNETLAFPTGPLLQHAVDAGALRKAITEAQRSRRVLELRAENGRISAGLR